MFLSEILISSCMVIHYILEEKWCLVKYLNPANFHLIWITKAKKDFTKRLDYKDIKFPVKIRDTDKIEKRDSVRIRAFAKENKEKHAIYASEPFFQKNMLIYYWK